MRTCLINMDIYRDETEFTDMDMIQKVVGMFESNPRMQRIVRYGLLGLEYKEDTEDNYDNWVHEPHFHDYPRISDAMSSDRLRGIHTKSSHSSCQSPIQYFFPAHEPPCPASLKIQSKESDAERNARLLEEMKKKEEKVQKKQLKKQKQKERKQLEKEKHNAVKSEEGKTDLQQSEVEECKSDDEKSKDDKSSSVNKLALAKDTGSKVDEFDGHGSDNGNSFDSEDLDMTSTFVTKAALIAKRKLEQKQNRQEKKEKKKIPVEECKTVSEKANERPKDEKKDSAAHSIPTIEENIRISTELAVIGNKFASSGDFNMAVKYFTNAIKYNPTELKLFGNRSFCFEKMQEYEKALTDAELCLNMCPGWVKGLFRKGRALAGLKRYKEAAQAFNEVLKLENSYAEAAQELMRVQIMQLMEYGFTREQSSNALIIHGTVKKALEVLSTLNHQPGDIQSALSPVQVVNITGVSPVLSANTNPAGAAAVASPSYLSQSQDAPKTTLKQKPFSPIQNMSNVQYQHRPTPNMAVKSSNENSQPPLELFPVWVGNLFYPVSESELTSLFNKAGVVYSVKVLAFKRCAFVNFTKQEFCDEAIRKFNGFELNGMKIAVRYPDRFPHGMGISRSALKADDLQSESVRQNTFGGRRPVRPQRCDHRDNDKN